MDKHPNSVRKATTSAVMKGRLRCNQTQDAIALLTMMLQAERSVAAKHGACTKDVLGRLRAHVRADWG